MNSQKKQIRFKQVVLTGLVFIMILSFSGISIENTIAKTDGITKNLEPATIVKNYYSRNGYDFGRFYKKFQDTDKLNFIKIDMPIQSRNTQIKDETATNEIARRFYIDNVKYLPCTVVDEKVEKGQDSSEEKTKNLIIEGITNHLNLASLDLITKDNGSFDLRITGIDEKLKNYPNTIVTVYIIENFVNCNFTFSEWEKEYKTSLESLVRSFPLSPEGKTKVKVENGKTTTINFKADIPEDRKNNHSLLVVIQSSEKNKDGDRESLAAGIVSLADTKPARLMWNNWSDNPIFRQSHEKVLEVAQQIGLSPMNLQIELTDENTNWQFLRFKIAQTDWEKERYEIIGAELNPELKAKKFEFDPEKREVIVELVEPYNKLGKTSIVSLITHNLKNDDLKLSASYQFQDLVVENSNHELIYLDKIQDIKRKYPVQYLIKSEPCDFNGDTWIDDKDMQTFLPEFGKNSKDKDFDEKFDLVPDRRINIKDLCALLKEINEQDNLMEKVKKSNPSFQKETNSANDQNNSPFHFFRKQMYCLEYD